MSKDCHCHKERKLTGQYLFPYPFPPIFREYSPRLPANFVINFNCHFFKKRFSRVYVRKFAHSKFLAYMTRESNSVRCKGLKVPPPRLSAYQPRLCGQHLIISKENEKKKTLGTYLIKCCFVHICQRIRALRFTSFLCCFHR